MASLNNTEESVTRTEEYAWWFLSYLVEGVLILLVNIVTIVVFWRRRFALRRTAYLLINLAFADLLIGVDVLVLGVMGTTVSTFVHGTSSLIFATVSFFPSAASICSLAVIAAERAFAIAKPLKHRTVSSSSYYGCIVFVWVIAPLVCSLMALVNFLELAHLTFVVSSIFCLCLLVICLSYAIIWWSSTQRLNPNPRRDLQNRKLAKTLLIVIFLSLATVIPGQIATVIAAGSIETRLTPSHLFAFLFLEFLNAFLNPFVYVLRMPDFRKEIRSFCK